MKIIFLPIIFLITSISLLAQSEITSSDISKFAHSFDISNNQLIGSGADTLRQRILESQFFLLGEQHFSPQISEITNIFLPILASNNFKNFVVELGPNSSEKMISELHTNNTLSEFNTEFFNSYNDIPLPFFDGKEDEMFLKTALDEGFNIWGVDQEFLSSQLFLVDELYRLSNDKDSIEILYLQAKEFLEKEFRKDSEQKNYPMFTTLLQSKMIKSYFEKSNSLEQQKIISALKISWKIYAFNETKEYRKNNFTRMEYMKRNFGINYKMAQSNDSLPKVFVKMGATHLAYGKTWLGIYDLGTMIKELSYFNGTTSTSINCFSRYTEDEDGIVSDYLDEEDGEDYRLILELAKKNSWVLVEAKSILNLAKLQKIDLNESLSRLISGYDYILFSPTKTQVKLNYTHKN